MPTSRLLMVGGAAAGLLATLGFPADAQQRWFRGNTHAHTDNSDGDSPPDVAVRWYRERGYHFTFVTDHEFITDVGPLNALFGAEGRFLVLSGQEVTQRVADTTHPDGVRQAHVNAPGVTRVIRPLGERNVATATMIAATYARNLAVELPDSILFELWNGHPMVYNDGGVDVVPVWDRRYLIEFIGRGGQVLAAVPGVSGRYALAGTEGDVRVRVTHSSGGHAWTQSVRVP